MAEPITDQNLHLPSLVIKNFRGIDELTIPRLGRVTLLAGKNGVGKTTVLDAVRVWAARGLIPAVDQVLRSRGDYFISMDEGSQRTVADRTALFTDRLEKKDTVIRIGPTDDRATLQMRVETPDDRSSEGIPPPKDPLYDVGLRVRVGTGMFWPAHHEPSGQFHPTAIPCRRLGPDAPNDESIEQYWNDVALSHYEDRAIEGLNLITGSVVERVALIDPASVVGKHYRRRLMAKVQGKEYRVPLRTLGDGALRLFGTALSLVNSTNGFLLIDEAENGIHHSIQAKFWNMVLQTAQRNNVQVIATTHSWDCVVGFAKAANELEDVEGVLYRIQRNGERLRAVEYAEENLAAAAKHRIEVR